jgi:hypothetical protein
MREFLFDAALFSLGLAIGSFLVMLAKTRGNVMRSFAFSGASAAVALIVASLLHVAFPDPPRIDWLARLARLEVLALLGAVFVVLYVSIKGRKAAD